MADAPDVVVVGLGYVGLTLAVTLANRGFRVWGYERQPEVVEKLRAGQSHLFEPGVKDILEAQLGRHLHVEARLPERVSGVTIICVSTPVSPEGAPNLSNLRAAAEQVSEAVIDGALVIVRSTVPVQTCRRLVLPLLRARHKRILLAYCPERTIQGRALHELHELPQIVGGVDVESAERAIELWQRVTKRVVRVSSLEAAEMVKLINNAHTDLIYSFGNEVAMMAYQLRLDPMELIHAANVDYPRPSLARPGFVAGPCMSKDPYLLVSSLNGMAYRPCLVPAARRVNESLPGTVAHHFLELLRNRAGPVDGAKVIVCGFAYKGWPETDDMRGSPVLSVVQILREQSLRIYGHDYLVSQKTIAACGATPVSNLENAFASSRAVLFLNEHPTYRELPVSELAQTMQRPAVVYDCWRMFDGEAFRQIPDICYAGIGYES